MRFQSTLPVWGATPTELRKAADDLISIHAPRVGSDIKMSLSAPPEYISIHAPRVGSDCAHGRQANSGPYFNPRSPCGERLGRFLPAGPVYRHFNPRSPCGERLPEP